MIKLTSQINYYNQLLFVDYQLSVDCLTLKVSYDVLMVWYNSIIITILIFLSGMKLENYYR